MAIDATALAALAAFALILVVLGAVFFGIVQSSKNPVQEEPGPRKREVEAPQEDEVS